MKPVIDMEKEYGLVLEGGGAKGAYQIGVWKAMKEAGLKIKGIAGTSVGGLNGAFICMGNLEAAEHVWENLTYSQIMDVPDDVAAGLVKGTLPIGDSLQAAGKFLSNGGVDVGPLKELIAECIDPEVIHNSPIDLYVTTFNVDEMKEEQIDMKEIPLDQIQDYLLATAYMAPVFKVEKLNGTRYIDGGAADNVPVDVLLERDYKDLIVVRIFGIGMVKRVTIPDDVSVIEIAPKKDLGNILEFDGERSKKNMLLGYLDGMRTIYGLTGILYYIDEDESEEAYLQKLLSISSEVRGELFATHHLGDPEEMWIRKLVEKVFPAIAAELKLGSEWTYRGLFLGMLEATAKMCRITKLRIYTVPELMDEVAARIDKAKTVIHDLDFVQIIEALVKKETKE